MSDKIDRRIVEMSFENKQFESGIKKSKDSLLNFSKALEKSVGSNDPFSGLEKSVNNISHKFSAMEAVAVGSLMRIGSTATQIAGNLVKSLSIDQFSAGLDKYQQKIQSIQAITASGYSMEATEEQMDRLMWFADETSYSFADMARNMASFTAAGVGLDEASKAMQGISTWAALSGKNTFEAGIAMFNLSQAIGMGYVDTMNWRSIMLQGMNTKMFKQVAIDVGLATGALKEGQVTVENFDANLRTKWFTKSLLIDTLNQYSNYADAVYEVQKKMNFDSATEAMEYMEEHAEEFGDVLNQVGNAAFKAAQESKSFSDSFMATADAVSSGWMKTYEIIFGKLDEAKRNFTSLTEILWTVFASGAQNRNQMLAWLKEMGGISNVFEGAKNVIIGFLTVLRSVSQAFDAVFPPKTKEQWLALTVAFKNFSAGLIISEKSANNIKRTFQGVFAVLDVGVSVVGFLVRAFFEILGVFVPLGEGLLDVTANLGDFLVFVSQFIHQSGIFEYGLVGVKIAAVLLKEALSGMVKGIYDFVTGLRSADSPAKYLRERVSEIIAAISRIFSIKPGKSSGIIGIFKMIGETISSILGEDGLGGFIKQLSDPVLANGGSALKSIGEVIAGMDFSKITNFVVGGFLLVLVAQIARAVSTFSDLTVASTGLVKSVAGTVTNVNKLLQPKKMTTSLKDVAISIALLAGSIKLLSTIPVDDAVASLKLLAGSVLILVAAFAAVKAIGLIPSGSGKTGALAMVGIAATVAVMAATVKALGKINKSEAEQGVAVVASLTRIAVESAALMAVFSRISSSKNSMGKEMRTLSIGVLAMAGAIVILAKITPNEIAKGLKALSGMMLVIAAYELFASVAARIGGGKKTSVNILSMSIGLLAMIGVMKVMTMIDRQTLTSALPNLALMASVIAGFEILVGLAARIGGGNKLTTNLLMMSAAMLAMTGVIGILSLYDQSTIDTGIKVLASMGLIIGGVELLAAIAARIGGQNAKLQSILLGVTATMTVMTGLIGVIGLYTEEQIQNGIKVLETMVLLIGAIELLSVVAGRLSGANAKIFTTMIGVSATVLSLAAAMLLLSLVDQTSLNEAAKSLSLVLGVAGLMAVGFAVLVQAVSKMNSSAMKISSIAKNLAAGLVIMAAILGATLLFFVALTPVLDIIESISWSSLEKFIAGLAVVSLLFGAIAAMSPVLMAAGAGMVPMLLGTLATIAAVALVITAFTAIAALMSLLPTDTLIEGFDNLAIVGQGIGRFVGNFVGGIAGGSLEATGKSLLAFFQMVEQINPEAVNTLASLSKAFLAITASAVIDGIANFINGESSIATFGEQLGELLASFQNLTADQAEHASEVLAAMTPMAANLEKFSIAASTIPNSGPSVLSAIFGENNIHAFGAMLVGLVGVFKLIEVDSAVHATEVLEAMTPMADNLAKFSEVAGTIPNTGPSVLTDIFGQNDIDAFGVLIANLVGIFHFLNETEIESATTNLEALAVMIPNLSKFSELASGIPNGGISVISKLMGGNDIDDFAVKLSGIVSAFASIPDEDVTKAIISLTSLSNLIPILSDFSKLSNDLKDSGGLAQLGSGNTTLDEFAKQLAKFVKNLKGVDFSIVQPALASMEAIKESFEVVGANVIKNAAESFNNNKTVFTKAIGDILGQALLQVEAYKDDFTNAGRDLIRGLQNGMTSEKASVVKASSAIAYSVYDTARKKLEVNSPSKLFTDIGKWCSIGLANGLNSDAAVKGSASMAMDIESAIRDGLGVHSESTLFKEIGGWIPTSITSGIDKGKNALFGVAESMGINTGDVTISGITDSLSSGESGVTSALTSLIDILSDSGAEAESGGNGIVDAAANMGAAMGGGVTESFTEALTNPQTGIAGSNVTQAVKSELDTLSAMIEEGNFYGQLSLKEELALYREKQNVYKQGSEERKKIDREIFTLEKQIYDTQKQYIDDVKEAEKEAADDRLETEEQYAKDVEDVNRELAATKKELIEQYSQDVADVTQKQYDDLAAAQKQYDEASQAARENADKQRLDKEKKYSEDYNKILDDAEKERQSLRQKYADDQKRVNDQMLKDIDAANKAYEDAVASRAASIVGSYGLFDAVGDDEEVSGDELLQNLRDQGAAFSEWEQMLTELENRGVGEALLSELQEMGPAANAQLRALLSLTSVQLDEYVSLFQGKYNFARVKAEAELVGLKEDTSVSIQAIIDQAAQDLYGLEETFQNAMSGVDESMEASLADLKSVLSSDLAQINSELSTALAEAQATFDETTANINEDTAKQLAELNKTFTDEMTSLNKESVDKLTELKKNFDQNMIDINKTEKEKLDELKKSFETSMEEIKDLTTEEMAEANKNMTAEIEAMNSNAESRLGQMVGIFGDKLEGAAGEVNRGMDTMNAKIDQSFINAESSYSAAGENLVQGFADGIEVNSWVAQNAATAMAEAAIRSAENVLDEHSPSRVFRKIGAFVSQGFALGIQDDASKSVDATNLMSEGIINAIDAAIALMDSDSDYTPTITPVVDLSNIESASLAFPSLFGSASATLSANTTKNLAKDLASQNGSVSGQSTTNTFNISELVVREEADIKKIAYELNKLTVNTMRGGGHRPAFA